MKTISDNPAALGSGDAQDLLSPLLQGAAAATPQAPAAQPALIHGVVVGELLAIAEDGTRPLVRWPAMPDLGPLAARSVVDLRGSHVGRGVVLMFEHGQVTRPIVMGVMQGGHDWPAEAPSAAVQVDVDGQRLIVSAADQLVLRCGKASITLTKAGKVLISGTYVSTRSSGSHHVMGASVLIN